MHHKVLELVAYSAGNTPRRAATVRIEDGRYFDVNQDDEGRMDVEVICITDAKEILLNIPPNGGKMILTGPRSEISRIK